MTKGQHAAVIYGKHFPNRLFVGCLPAKATADDLSKCFSNFGKLMEAKVVLDEKACSKRFGFVTYSTKEEAEEVLKQKTLYLLGKKVNVGPAVKKEEHDFIPDEPVKIVTSTRVNIEKQNSKSKPRYRFTITRSDPRSLSCCKTCRSSTKESTKESKPTQAAVEGDRILKPPQNFTPPTATQSYPYEPKYIQSTLDPYHPQFQSQFSPPPLIPSHFMPPSPTSPKPTDIYEPYSSHHQGPLTFIPPSPTDFYQPSPLPTPLPPPDIYEQIYTNQQIPPPMYFMSSSPVVPSSAANCQFVFVPSF